MTCLVTDFSLRVRDVCLFKAVGQPLNKKKTVVPITDEYVDGYILAGSFMFVAWRVPYQARPSLVILPTTLCHAFSILKASQLSPNLVSYSHCMWYLQQQGLTIWFWCMANISGGSHSLWVSEVSLANCSLGGAHLWHWETVNNLMASGNALSLPGIGCCVCLSSLIVVLCFSRCLFGSVKRLRV